MTIAAAYDSVSLEAVRLELARIQESRVFSQSLRLCKFLHFTVEHTIAGKARLLKEYLIGCEVYNRKPPYDPTQDSIVRTEARRLRFKLKQYYETEGKYDPVRIHFDVGRYVPSFVHRLPAPQIEQAAGGDDSRPAVETNRLLFGLESLRGLAQTSLSAAFAEELSEEIAHLLMRHGVYSMIAGTSEQTAGCRPSGNPMPLCRRFPSRR